MTFQAQVILVACQLVGSAWSDCLSWSCDTGAAFNSSSVDAASLVGSSRRNTAPVGTALVCWLRCGWLVPPFVEITPEGYWRHIFGVAGWPPPPSGSFYVPGRLTCGVAAAGVDLGGVTTATASIWGFPALSAHHPRQQRFLEPSGGTAVGPVGHIHLGGEKT